MSFSTNMFFVILASVCAAGTVMKRSNCQHAVQVPNKEAAKKAFLGKFPAVLAQVGDPSCQWQCYLNRYPDLQAAFGKTNMKKGASHWSQYGKKEKRDCSCPVLDYHLAPPGASKCDFGESVPQDKCQQFSNAFVPNGKFPGRGLQLGSGGTCGDGGWGNVPTGCSIQLGGDYAPHYKTGDIGCPSYNAAYQLVCYGSPPPAPTLPPPPVVDECAETLEVVMTVNKVIEQATEVEEKAEKTETQAKELMETVAEVKAAKAEQAGAAAAQLAFKEKVAALTDEIKKEEEEVVEKKQEIKEDKKEEAVLSAPAKAAMKEAVIAPVKELTEKVEEEKLEAESKEEEKKAVEKEAAAKIMETVVAQADTAAKLQKFQAEEKALKVEAPLIDAEKIFAIKMEAVQVEQKLAVAAAAAAAPAAAPKPGLPPPKKSVAEEIKLAEASKVKIAVKLVDTAEKEAKVAKVEQEKAEKVMKEVAVEPEDQGDKIQASVDTIKNLEKAVKTECKPCKKKRAAIKKRLVARLKRKLR